MKRLAYQRVSIEEKKLIKDLTTKGKSLNHLSKLLNLGKTTIYYQVRKFKPKKEKNLLQI